MKLVERKLSRRSVMYTAGFAAGAVFIPAKAATNSDARMLALIGDRYHNPDYIRVSLDRTLQGLNLSIDYTIDYARISSALLKNYQLLLILRDGMIWPDGYLGPDAYSAYEANLENPNTFPVSKPVGWITEEQGEAVKDFVNSGGGFYALHNSSDISLFSKNFRDVMGGAYAGHPPQRPFQVHATQNSHPITQGISPFMVNDEQHYLDYDKDPRYIILESENIDGLVFENRGTKSPAGWAYDFGRGRVVFTAVGHTIHAMWNPQYVEIQKRAVRWLLKQL